MTNFYVKVGGRKYYCDGCGHFAKLREAYQKLSLLNYILFNTALYQILVDPVHFVLVILAELNVYVSLRTHRIINFLLAVAKALHLVDGLRMKHLNAAIKALGLGAASWMFIDVSVADFGTKTRTQRRPSIGRVSPKNATSRLKNAQRQIFAFDPWVSYQFTSPHPLLAINFKHFSNQTCCIPRYILHLAILTAHDFAIEFFFGLAAERECTRQ